MEEIICINNKKINKLRQLAGFGYDNIFRIYLAGSFVPLIGF